MHATVLIRIDMRGVGTKHEIGGEINNNNNNIVVDHIRNTKS